MERSVFHRFSALILVFVLLVLAAPVSRAESSTDVSVLMDRFEHYVSKPKAESVLEEPVHMTVRARNGRFIYVLSSPNGYAISSAAEGASIIVYARQDGFALGLVENTLIGGWMSESRLEEDNAVVPEEFKLKAPVTPEPETVPGMSQDELASLTGKTVRLPKDIQILEKAEIRYVESTYGNCIFSRNAPNGAILATVNEGTKVTVYARLKGFSLARTEDGSILGWMADQYLEPASREGKPNAADTAGLLEGMYRPVKGEYLEEYRTMYVRSSYGTRIYIFADPTKPDAERVVIAYANEAEACTPIARRNGFVFVITESGMRGWVHSDYLVYNY